MFHAPSVIDDQAVRSTRLRGTRSAVGVCHRAQAVYHASGPRGSNVSGRGRPEGCVMIKQFDSSYAGHIDLENVGYLGTPVNSRRYSNDQLISAHHKAEEQAKAMDRLGYGAFWMAQHHFQPEGTECLPNIIMLAVHLTHLTKRLKFHTGFNITPMWHPLRLAEDFAVADILTKGRVVFGVGRGYHT